MKKIFTLLTAVLFIGLLIFPMDLVAQINYNWEWKDRYNGDSRRHDYGRQVKIDAVNNIYTTGVAGTQSGSNTQLYTLKFSSDGTRLWSKEFKGDSSGLDEPNDLVIDNNNDIIAGGITFNGFNNDFLVIKYTGAGDTVFVQSFNGGNIDIGKSLATDAQNNVYISGESSNFVTNTTGATVKYNSNGDSLWASLYDILPSSSTTDNQGFLYISGIGSSLSGLLETVKINPADGMIMWSSTYEEPGTAIEIPNTILADNQGNIYVAGYSNGYGTDFDYLLIKYNTINGDTIWTRRLDGGVGELDRINKMIFDNAGNLVMTGWSTQPNRVDFLTVKYSPAGVLLWDKLFNESISDFGYGIAVDNNNNVFVAGDSDIDSSSRTVLVIYDSNGNLLDVTRDPLDDGVSTSIYGSCIAADGNQNMYVVGQRRLGQFSRNDGATIKFSAGPPVGMDKLSTLFSFRMMPNPADYSSRIEFSLTDLTNLSIEVFGLNGQMVYGIPSQPYSVGMHHLEIPTSLLADGIYVVQLRSETTMVSHKLLVTH